MRDEALQSVVDFARSSAYSKIYAGIPAWERDVTAEAYLAQLQPLSYEALQSLQLSHYPEKEIRYIASTFSTEELSNLFLLPQLRSARLALTKRCIEESQTPVALFASPMFWQMGPLFYRTCRDAQIPAALASPRNPPVTRQIIVETGVTYVCASPEVALDIYTELALHQVANKIKIWHLIVPIGQPAPLALPTGKTIIEYHLFPGVALGEGNTVDGLCHVYEDYLVEIKANQPLITSLTKEAFPLIRFLPTNVRAQAHDTNPNAFIFSYAQ